MRRTVLLALLGLALAAPAQAAVAPTQISRDPFGLEVAGQHSTQAEPDSFAFGDTVVAAFQVGRYATGAAAAIGWATSTDGGRTWRDGLLPSLTRWTTPGGPYSRVTDPVVAYDRVHGVWLVSVLALRDARGVVGTSAVVTMRSRDGITWTEAPAVVSPDVGSFRHDKNWIVCDNWPTSRYAGRCYTFWMDVATESIVGSTSLDGGLTWGEPVAAPDAAGNGAVPVVQPDGTLVVPFLVHRSAVAAFVSRDGGATFSRPVPIALTAATPTFGLRAPQLPSAEVAADGRVYVAWHSCDDRPGCSNGARTPAAQGIQLSSSLDGVSWTRPRRIPLGPQQQAHRLLPGLGVDAASAGAATRLAVVYYELGPFPCPTGCTIAARVATSGDAGATWSEPVILSPRPMALEWIADTPGGRMLGDYFSTSFVAGGVAVPVFVAAAPPLGEFLQQATYAARVPQLARARLRLAAAGVSATRARAGRRFDVSLAITRSDGDPSLAGARVTCTARARGKRLPVVSARVRGTRAACSWAVPRRAAGATVAWTVRVALRGGVAQRSSTARVA